MDSEKSHSPGQYTHSVIRPQYEGRPILYHPPTMEIMAVLSPLMCGHGPGVLRPRTATIATEVGL